MSSRSCELWKILYQLPLDIFSKVLQDLDLYDVRNLDDAACERSGRPILLEAIALHPPADIIEHQKASRQINYVKWFLLRKICLLNLQVEDPHSLPLLLPRHEFLRALYLSLPPQAFKAFSKSAIASKVTGLTFSACRKLDVEPSDFSHVRSLLCVSTQLDDIWFAEFLQHHPMLSELSIEHSLLLTDSFLAALNSAGHLTKLALRLNKRAAGRLTFLRPCCQRLRSLRLDLCELEDNDDSSDDDNDPRSLAQASMEQLALHCTLLEELTVTALSSYMMNPSTLIAFVQHCSRLQVIDCPQARLTDTVLEAMTQATCVALEVLRVRWAVTTLHAVQRSAAVLARLRQFDVRDATSTHTASHSRRENTLVHAVTYMSALRTWTVPTTILGHSLWAVLQSVSVSPITQLVHFDASSLPSYVDSDALIKVVHRNPLLESFRGPSPEDAPTTLLFALGSNCPHLQALTLLVGGEVSDVGVVVLAKGCPRLRDVYIAPCGELTNCAVLALARCCRRLECLSLRKAAALTESALLTLYEGCRRLCKLQVPAGILSVKGRAKIERSPQRRGVEVVAYQTMVQTFKFAP